MFGKPKKSLGQNFLIQPNIVSKIIFESKLEKDETVLEVGPGRGALTRALLTAGAKVVAVEKDDDLFTELHETFAKEISEKKLILVRGDILELLSRTKIHLTPNPSPKGRGETAENPLPFGEGAGGEVSSRFTVVANIPYYITGELLRHMLSGKVQPYRMTLMVQKEVATRIVAKDGHESLLSISVKAYGMPRYAGTVGKGNFYPVPKVDSAILQVENISKNFFQNFSEEKFFSVLHLAFAHKRKLLLNNLSSLVSKPQLTALFLERNLSLKSRAEELSLADWGYLVERL